MQCLWWEMHHPLFSVSICLLLFGGVPAKRLDGEGTQENLQGKKKKKKGSNGTGSPPAV